MRNVEPLCYVFQILQNLIVLVFVKAEPGILHKLHFDIYPLYLDLHFRQAMLPDNDIRCDTILAVIEKDDHSIRIHGLASIEVEIAKVGHNVLRVVSLHSLLEPLNEVLILASFLEFLNHLLQVPLELSLKIFLRSKRPLPTRLISQEIQSEPIDHIDDLFGPFLERLLLIFGRRVCANVDVVSALCDLSAVDFVDNVVDIFEVVGVGDDLVAGNDILVDNHVEGC